MKLNETRDIAEEDNFHDASDSVENTSQNLSPENKDAVKISALLTPNTHNDTFDQLTASFEKVAVSDTSDMHTPVKSKEKPLIVVDHNKTTEIKDCSESIEEPKEAITPPETSSKETEEVPNSDSQLCLQEESGKAVERSANTEEHMEASLAKVEDNVGTGAVEEAGKEEDVIVPQKGYKLEFLDKMDDPNFDPFSTKAAVTNSPEKEKSEAVASSVAEEGLSVCLNKSGTNVEVSEKMDSLEVQEVKEVNCKETSQVEESEVVIEPEQRSENNEDVSTEDMQQSGTLTGKQDTQDEEELAPPQKGYNLDFFDKLDDPNFDPFSTKTAVSNSPEKATKEIVAEKSGAETQAEQPVEVAKPANVTQEQVLSEKECEKQEGESHALPKEDSAEGPSENQQEEEIIPPKKEYNLDFLDNIEDPNFNPFTTKVSVSNSPERKEAPVSLVESEPMEEKENPIKLLEMQENEVKTTEDVESKADGTVVEPAKEEVMKEQAKPEEAMEVSEEKDEDEDEPIPPKKGYNLDFLDNLNDPNLDPFSTKTTVTNSPDKKNGVVADSKKADEAPNPKEMPVADVVEKEEKVAQVETSENTLVREESTSCVKEEVIATSEVVLSKEDKEEEMLEMQEDDEPIPPKKGYNLDFFDKLDDPNFDPFSTKTTVNNSPDKNNGPAAESKKPNEAPKPKEKAEKRPVAGPPKEKGVVTQKTLPVKEDAEIKTMKPKEDPIEEKMEGQEEDEIIPPKKGYNLDFLDNLDDPNLDPFSTKTTVTNSPDKKDGPATEKKPAEGAPKPKKVAEKLVVDVKEKDTGAKTKQTSENASRTKAKDAAGHETRIPKEAEELGDKAASEAQEEDKLIPPKMGYNLDLDNLDDPNFNPFATKVSVSNSPDRKKEPVVESKKTEESKVSEEVPKPEEEKKQNKEAEKPVDKKKKKPVAKAPKDKVPEETQDDTPALPKGGYNLDLNYLDDPNFNPFATKTAVSNSPDRKQVSVSEKVMESSVSTEERRTQTEAAKSVKKPVKKTPETEVAEDMEADIVPQKGYQLDILDNLNDPNFNPFATKAAVSNSPDKKKSSQEEVQAEDRKNQEITKSEFASSLGSIDFDQISKEAIKLASEVTPKPQTPEEQKVSEQALPRDVFSPLPAKHSSTKQDTFGAFGMDEFTSATECKEMLHCVMGSGKCSIMIAISEMFQQIHINCKFNSLWW